MESDGAGGIRALLRDMARAVYLLVESDGAGGRFTIEVVFGVKKAAKAFCGKRKTAGAGCAERRYLLMFRFW